MFFTDDLILKAFNQLRFIDEHGDGKGARERTSALRYFFATAELLHRKNLQELDLSVNQKENREQFVQCVGHVVQVKGNLYTNNFKEEFQEIPNYRVGNNFLTSALKRDGDYPGRPAPLLIRETEKVKLHPNYSTNIKLFGDWNKYRIALGFWLLRESEFSDTAITKRDIATESITKLKNRYGDNIGSLLFIDETEIENFIADSEALSGSEPTYEEIIKKYYQGGTTLTSNSIIGENLIVYGAPGTGKSYFLNKYIPHIRTVFHPDYQNSDFVGSYRPYVLPGGEITYRFVPGPFIKAFIEALNRDDQFHLIIEEINRSNASSVFGEIFQLLDRDEFGRSIYSIDPEQSLLDYLNETLKGKTSWEGKLFIPSNLTILATMNSADQGVSLIDSAFKRRWNFKYMPIDFDMIEGSDVRHMKNIPYGNKEISWVNLAQALNNVLSKAGLAEDRLIGQFYMSKKELSSNEAIEKSLTGKLFIYLWDDVLRHGRRGVVFNIGNGSTYRELVEGYLQGDIIFSHEVNKELGLV